MKILYAFIKLPFLVLGQILQALGAAFSCIFTLLCFRYIGGDMGTAYSLTLQHNQLEEIKRLAKEIDEWEDEEEDQ